MGNYVFTVEPLMEVLAQDARTGSSRHDIGGDVVPRFVDRRQASVYDFSTNQVPGETERDRGYWRDVGTLDAYFDAHMDLVSVHPIFNLYNRAWPIYSAYIPLPPAKFVFDVEGRRGQAVDSRVGPGVIVSGGTVRRSVLSPDVHVHSHALVEDCVLLDSVEVGRDAVVCRAIVDKQVVIPPGARIGVDPERDAARFTVSAGGVVVIGKRQVIEEPV
jgi:glucose-1-phosphate adenylyltransferase